MKSVKYILIVAIGLFLASCTPKAEQTDLYFGTATPGGGEVTTEEWIKFSETVVAKYFPLGSTEWHDAKGRYKDPTTGQTITERAIVLTVVGEKNAEREAAVAAVVKAYREKFKQQAVFRVNTAVEMELITGR